MGVVMLHGEMLSLAGRAVGDGFATNGHAPLVPATIWTKEQADEWFRRETLTAPPADLAEPCTLPWFLALEYHRHHRQASWLVQALEFSRHTAETVLALGHSLGTDWVQYARFGSQVIVGCPNAEELAVARQHFVLRGLTAVFLHCPSPTIPFPAESVDLACISQMMDDIAKESRWLAEVYRVLKPGGKLIISECLPDYSLRSGRRITQHLLPLLGAFDEVRVRRYHLRRAELAWYWRCLPRRWLERFLGRFLLVKARKPVANHSALPIAA